MNKTIYRLTALVTLLASVSAHATTSPVTPTSVDEPSLFGLLAAGAVAGLLIWRAKNKR